MKMWITQKWRNRLSGCVNSAAMSFSTVRASSKIRSARPVSTPELNALAREPREIGLIVGQMTEFGVVLGVVRDGWWVKYPRNQAKVETRFK